MLLRRLLLAAMAATVSAAPLQAQAIDPNTNDQIKACILSPSIFTTVTPTACVGFFDKNSMQFGTGATLSSSGNTGSAWSALNLLGFDMSETYKVREKVESWNGTNDFSTLMYGVTVVGIHWGNYPGGPNDGIGNVSAFYLFDAGTSGISSLDLKNVGGVSNAAILYTGPMAIVSEPMSLMLMGVGVAGLCVVSSQRRKG